MAEKEHQELDRQLMMSLILDDFAEFKKLLLAGANPMGVTVTKGDFLSTTLCKSTVQGNLQHERGGSAPTPLTCAIIHRNMRTYLHLVELGVSLDEALNPMFDKKLRKTPFIRALYGNHFNFAWDLLQRTTIDAREIGAAVRVLERNGGIEEHPNQKYRDYLVDWLRNQGVAVNPPPPAPAELYRQ